MTHQLGALWGALIDAGVAPRLADNAAEEVASYKAELAGTGVKLEEMKGSLHVM